MLLAIETATDACSVALLVEGEVTAVTEILRRRAHAEQLAPVIAGLLKHGESGPEELEAVAVSAGPGSYTGLRIGVSAAKGLCLGTGAALVAIPSLEALASTICEAVRPEDLIIASFPSRRGELYVAAFRVSEVGLHEVAPPAALAHEEIPAWLPELGGDLWLVGDGGSTVATLIDREYRLLSALLHRPTAQAVGRLGWERWRSGTEEDLAAFEPFYLKPFEARAGASIFDRLPH